MLCLLSRATFIKVFKLAAAQALDLLLESGTLEDIKFFCQQFYLIGTEISKNLLNKMLIKVRTMLVSNKHNTVAKLWLLLSIDIANNNFEKITAELLSYYKDQLGEQELLFFEIPKKFEPCEEAMPGRPILGAGASLQNNYKNGNKQEKAHE